MEQVIELTLINRNQAVFRSLDLVGLLKIRIYALLVLYCFCIVHSVDVQEILRR